MRLILQFSIFLIFLIFFNLGAAKRDFAHNKEKSQDDTVWIRLNVILFWQVQGKHPTRVATAEGPDGQSAGSSRLLARVRHPAQRSAPSPHVGPPPVAAAARAGRCHAPGLGIRRTFGFRLVPILSLLNVSNNTETQTKLSVARRVAALSPIVQSFHWCVAILLTKCPSCSMNFDIFWLCRPSLSISHHFSWQYNRTIDLLTLKTFLTWALTVNLQGLTA